MPKWVSRHRFWFYAAFFFDIYLQPACALACGLIRYPAPSELTRRDAGNTRLLSHRGQLAIVQMPLACGCLRPKARPLNPIQIEGDVRAGL